MHKFSKRENCRDQKHHLVNPLMLFRKKSSQVQSYISFQRCLKSHQAKDRMKRICHIREDNQDKSDNDQFSIYANETMDEEDSDASAMLTNNIFA